MKLFKPLKPVIANNKKIFGFDIETKIQDNHNVFYMGSIIGDNFKKVFYDKEEMTHFIIHDKIFDNSYLYAHNLKFDFFLLFDKSKYINKFKFIDRNGLIYARYIKPQRHYIHFVDTMNYANTSLSKLSNIIGMEKLPKPAFIGLEPKDEAEKHILEEYNIQDSTITYKFAKFMENFCNDLGCKFKITIASIGLDNWRRNYQQDAIIQEPFNILTKHYLGGFHGGRTELFKRGLFKKVYYYDFNSHYPAICKDGVDNKGSYPNPTSVKYIKNPDKDIIDYEGISKVTIEAPDLYSNVLGIRYNNMYAFPKGVLTGWFTNVELRYAIEKGYNIKNISESIYYKTYFTPFKYAVEDLYKMRMEYKKDDNIAMSQMIKIMMNSGLFGKFAQKIEQQNMITDEEFYIDEKRKLYTVRHGKRFYLNDYVIRGNYVFYRTKTEKAPIFIHPILASYTTALARLKLLNKLEKSKKDLIYCDTDSIVVKKPLFESSNKLGELKLEHIGKEAMFIRNKWYYIEDDEIHIRSKGVRKIIDKEDFMKVVRERIITQKRFTTLKESYVRKMPLSSIIEVVKHLSVEDIKRKWSKPFDPNEEQDSNPLYIT